MLMKLQGGGGAAAKSQFIYVGLNSSIEIIFSGKSKHICVHFFK